MMSKQVAMYVPGSSYERESCFSFSNSAFFVSSSALCGNREFYSSNEGLTPPVKYDGKKKFRERLLVWTVISGKSVAKIHIIDRFMEDQHLYMEKN